ncbi:DNA cytosine methyltransferase [Pseudomonas sp. BN515]|uniref:DNA cytosine methyltransferase n=1 Tax=Pseudomonas sp. BN515 TaxID=2567892 RepID=UPI002457D97D|nr:DNA cytosine methyltransferase [Pseudomonas sp. BN515]MDH4870588.1 DNA cytosine methyltransferase [Pseudomonas sp. BN515]
MTELIDTSLEKNLSTTKLEAVEIGTKDIAPLRKPRTKIIKAIDLFAGAGGFSLGAIKAGVKIAGALEINANAAKTYAENIRNRNGKPVPLINGDILPLKPAEALKAWKIKPSQCDIIIGGPPCQGFSTHRINDSGVDDPRNRLLGRYFEYVAEIRPRFFLVENVPGLLWPRHADYLKKFYEMGEAEGYYIHQPITLNACDFGVPQNRKRVFILGIDKHRPIEISWPPESSHTSPFASNKNVKKKPTWLTAASAFLPVENFDPNNIHMNHSPELVDLFQRTPINGGSRAQAGRVLECHKSHDGHYDVYGRIDPRKPAPTMTTACINPSKGRFVHPTENHGITLRQAARLQTFPDNFIFYGGLMSAGEQIGNAVPVTLAEAILKHIVSAIKTETNAKNHKG